MGNFEIFSKFAFFYVSDIILVFVIRHLNTRYMSMKKKKKKKEKKVPHKCIYAEAKLRVRNDMPKNYCQI